MQDGAENGFLLGIGLGLTHKALLDGGSFSDLPGVPGWIQPAAQPLMRQLREFMQLLDWDKQHEESQEESWSRLEELRESGKKNQESIQADLDRLEKEKAELDEEQEQLKEDLKESRQKEADLQAARRRLEETRRQEREARERLEAERRRSWSFSARGDPIICPENGNGEIVRDLPIQRACHFDVF